MQGSVARAQGSAHVLRRSTDSGDDLAVENARLRREVVRLQAGCDQHEADLLRLTQALWRLRQEVRATESPLAQYQAGEQR